MNILLTGGSGLIGSELTEKLIENGHQVRILTREKDIELELTKVSLFLKMKLQKTPMI